MRYQAALRPETAILHQIGRAGKDEDRLQPIPFHAWLQRCIAERCKSGIDSGQGSRDDSEDLSILPAG
ncbi:hypothetical protein [Chitinasiproducens palmae]|uniref:hypothetical protein n=1 Tax=Chitinasiproducens palmae TaxID=1770053 RepID=UPI000B88CEBD|nr:hypothetical protein [Chitinasiproducens palmae]